jgi:hypothetical protein
MDKLNYYQKRDEIISKFSEGFIEEHIQDAMCNAIIENMIRGMDVYAALEIILKDHKKMQESYFELIMNSPLQTKMIIPNQQDK